MMAVILYIVVHVIRNYACSYTDEGSETFRESIYFVTELRLFSTYVHFREMSRMFVKTT